MDTNLDTSTLLDACRTLKDIMYPIHNLHHISYTHQYMIYTMSLNNKSNKESGIHNTISNFSQGIHYQHNHSHSSHKLKNSCTILKNTSYKLPNLYLLNFHLTCKVGTILDTWSISWKFSRCHQDISQCTDHNIEFIHLQCRLSNNYWRDKWSKEICRHYIQRNFGLSNIHQNS